MELVEASIAQCEQLEPHLNALALTVFDRARESAHAADKALARRKGGDLCGIPVTIKDSQWLAGFPCANGSLTLQDFIPERSSAAVERLEQAGAVILAKTTCPEFSLSGITESALYGRTSNPWVPTYLIRRGISNSSIVIFPSHFDLFLFLALFMILFGNP